MLMMIAELLRGLPARALSNDYLFVIFGHEYPGNVLISTEKYPRIGRPALNTTDSFTRIDPTSQKIP